MLQGGEILGSRSHAVSYSLGNRDSFPGGNLLGCEADHPGPSSSEVTNACCYISAASYAFPWYNTIQQRTTYVFGILSFWLFMPGVVEFSYCLVF